MKSFKKVLLLMFISIIFSCKHDFNQIQTKTVQLKFESSSNNKQNFTIYDITINSLGEIELNNDRLCIVEAIDEETEKESFVIVENSNSTEKENNSIFNKSFFQRGYFFTGVCVVYGTMYYGDNGVNLFVPCGINCIGFGDICPNWNEAFA